MTGRLRESLREAASDVPVYQVHERAVRTARRTRRRMAAAAAAALVLVALAPLVLRGGGPPAAMPGAPGGPALPDRIGLPVLGALHATDVPRLGPASVIFSGQARGLTGWDEDGVVGIVGADSDRYRVHEVGYEAPAGEEVVLSPDGRRIAVPAGSSERPRIDLVDLVTGHVRPLSAGVPGSVDTAPVGWAPDGESLVVRDTVPANPERSAYRNVLSLARIDTGRRVHLADGEQLPTFGNPVAFSADGTRLAFQIGDQVVVTGVDGLRLSSFALPGDDALAGKGAWQRDGGLTVVSREPDSARWGLHRVDPVSGRDLGRLELPAVADVTAVRLLGWGPDGSAFVVAYRPEPGAPARFDQPLEMDQRTAYGNVRTVRVLALAPGAAAPTTVLTAPDQVLAVDVADDVLRTGRIRDADPPRGVGGRFWWWAGLGCLVLVCVVALRRARTRRPVTPAAGPGG